MNAFTVIPDYISLVTEALVVTSIELAMKGQPSKSGDGRNRILRYGWDYSTDEHLGDPPDWIPVIDGTDSWTINQYESGRGISPHIDAPKFGDEIKILSLGAIVFMRLISPQNDELIVQMPARSLCTLSGNLRWLWKHATLPVKNGTRYSIVYRTLTQHQN